MMLGDRMGVELPDDLPDAGQGWCCDGACHRGPQGCTCWEPIYEGDQAPPRPGPETTRPAMCDGCAFRPGTDAHQAQLDDGLGIQREPFYCHAGHRRIIGWRHPSGATVDDVQGAPPEVDRHPHDADGSPSPRCKGWADRYARGPR